MKTLVGSQVFLRALEPTDLDYLFEVENDELLWEVGNTLTPYSRYILELYISESHRDIYEVKQLRLVICDKETEHAVGLIDLFDFDPKNKRVAVGIVIYPDEQKRKGYAFESLKLICKYAFTRLGVHQVYAGITEDNHASIALFEQAGFVRNGIKKGWNFSGGEFKDEYFYQRFKP